MSDYPSDIKDGLERLHRRFKSWRLVAKNVFGDEKKIGLAFNIGTGRTDPPPAWAVKAWAEYRKAHNLNGQQSLAERLLGALGVGIENAITQHDLAAILLADPRDIRKEIRTLRREGEDVATGNPGCWKARNEPERRQHVLGQLTSRARDENATVRLYLDNRRKKKGLTIREEGVLKQITELELGLQELLEEAES